MKNLRDMDYVENKTIASTKIDDAVCSDSPAAASRYTFQKRFTLYKGTDPALGGATTQSAPKGLGS